MVETLFPLATLAVLALWGMKRISTEIALTYCIMSVTYALSL